MTGPATPSWVMANAVARLPDRIKKELCLPLFGVKHGEYKYLDSIKNPDDQVLLDKYIRAGYLVSGSDYCAGSTALHTKDNYWSSPTLILPVLKVVPKFLDMSLGATKVIGWINHYFNNQKLYFYDAGDHLQLYLEKLVEHDVYNSIWPQIHKNTKDLGFIYSGDEDKNPDGGINIPAARWSATEYRTNPTLVRWYYLYK